MTAELERASRVLKEDGASLHGVLKALVESPTEISAKPTAPKTIKMSDDAHKALTILPAVFGRVQPSTVRLLTEEEQAALGEEIDVLDAVLDDLTARREAIKDAIRNHMDRVVEEKGDVKTDTPVDKHGHYVVARPGRGGAERALIPGTNRAWSREYRSGKVEVSGEELLALYEAGEIDRKTYLSFTREVRVLDEDKVFQAVRKNPRLLTVLARITKRGLPGTSLFIRKV